MPIVVDPIPTPSIRRAIARGVAAHLGGVTNATGYFGQIGAKNGLPGVENTPDTPPVKVPGTDLRVRPYFIVAPGIGGAGAETDLADTITDLDALFRVTAAAGDVEDLLALIDRIDARLRRWSPGLVATTTATWVCGPMRSPLGFEAQLLIDERQTPARHYTQLQYVLHANT